jgi:monoterpene epsilon-lactone hydrolase
VSEQLDAIVQMIRDAGMTSGDRTLQERRELLDASIPPFHDPDVTVEPVDAGGVPSEWVTHRDALGGRAVVHLHGGGYTSGSLNSHRAFAANLSRTSRSPVLLVDYRLAPEDPYPAAVDDADAAVRWVVDGGVDPASVVVSGDSAGGGLAAALVVRRRDDGAGTIGGAVLISPWTDLAMTGESYDSEDGRDPMCSRASLAPSAEAYLAGLDATDPGPSPLYADLSDLPPLLIHVGEIETLRDDSVRLAERARAAGTPVECWVAPGMVHVWHVFAGMVPESDHALEVVADWIRFRQDAAATGDSVWEQADGTGDW